MFINKTQLANITITNDTDGRFLVSLELQPVGVFRDNPGTFTVLNTLDTAQDVAQYLTVELAQL